MSSDVPQACQHVAQQLSFQEIRIGHIQRAINQGRKSPWAEADLWEEYRRRDDLEYELAACIDAHKPPPQTAPLPTQFNGTASLTLNHPRTAAPMTVEFMADLLFSSDRWTFTVGALPTWQHLIDTPFGSNTTTLSASITNGLYWPVESNTHPAGILSVGPIGVGTIMLDLQLRFDHSIDLGDIAEVDSNMSIRLLSRKPIDPEGYVGFHEVRSTIPNGILIARKFGLRVDGFVTLAP